MNKIKYTYIASCVFTKENPELSFRIQNYLQKKHGIQVIRCCVDKYKVSEFEKSMPEVISEKWKNIPHYKPFETESVMMSICHNCSAIFQETMPEVKIISLWEFILSDPDFVYPDFKNEKMTIQDCWRSYDNRNEQDAVRSLLHKMNIDTIELRENYERTKFCGVSLFHHAPTRNFKLAPKRFVENAEGMFYPLPEEEQIVQMENYCTQFKTNKVIAYCHYCLKGLKYGGKDGKHLAELLFPERFN